MRGEWVTIAELKKSLPADAVYVDIFRLAVPDAASAETGSPHYVAWLVPPASKRTIRVVDLGPADQIDQMVGQLQREMGEALKEIKEIGEREAALEWRRAAKPLAEAFFGPMQDELKDAKELIVSPDGALWLVSLDSLPLNDDRYAAEDFCIRYVLSGRDLLRTASSAKTSGNAVVFANPDFDSVDAKASNELSANRGRAAGANKIPRFSRLAATESEATAIFDNLAIYSKTTPRLVLDREATEEAVKTIQRPTALVLCTHGFFLPDQQVPKRDAFENVILPTDIQSLRDADGNRLENPLLRCGVALAGCNRRDELGPTTDDGLLTGLEVLGLDLTGTQLVVLSACETGVGEPRIGEGVASLRHAFLLAGAECVVSTLWSVESLETARFGNLFFKTLAEGESRSQALHSAK